MIIFYILENISEKPFIQISQNGKYETNEYQQNISLKTE